MASHPMGPGSAVPPSEWQSSAHVYTRGQLMAFLRAGVIALVLLGIPRPHRFVLNPAQFGYACGSAHASLRCAQRWSNVVSDVEDVRAPSITQRKEPRG